MKSFRSLTVVAILLTPIFLSGCMVDLDACLTIDLNNNFISGIPVFDQCLVGSEF